MMVETWNLGVAVGVVDDPDDLCRGAAAVILGANSKWPDSALERAIGAEADAATRQTMFLAILLKVSPAPWVQVVVET